MAAVLRSASGPGAGACLLAPTRPCHRMLDVQFAVFCRSRLYLDLPCMTGTCQHRRPNGTVCGAALDPKGVHAKTCPVGGWRVRRHNTGVNILADWCVNFCDCLVFKEQVLPAANPDHMEARLDLLVHSPLVAGRMCVDFTVVSALGTEALSRGSAVRDGVAATIAAR